MEKAKKKRLKWRKYESQSRKWLEKWLVTTGDFTSEKGQKKVKGGRLLVEKAKQKWQNGENMNVA